MNRSFINDRTSRIYWQYLNLHLQAHFRSKDQIFIVVSVVLTLGFILGLIYLSSPSDLSHSQILGTSCGSVETLVIPEPTSFPTPDLPPITTPPDSHVYSISIAAKPTLATISGILLADALVTTLDLPLVASEAYPIKKILYDTMTQDPWSATGPGIFNGHYYVIVSDSVSLRSQRYDGPWLTATIEPASIDLLPYLSDNQFCLIDADCQIRDSYCQKSAYNRFDKVLDSYSCVINNLPTQVFYDQKLGCPAIVGYITPQCLGNRCTTKPVNTCLTPSPSL